VGIREIIKVEPFMKGQWWGVFEKVE